MKRSKKYLEAVSKYDRTQVYDPQEALGLAKNLASAKFDETVEVHVRTGCDGRHADQQIRGAVVLPNGTGKTTFVKMLAGVIEPDDGKMDRPLKVAYKPQYISGDSDDTVQDMLYAKAYDTVTSNFFQGEVIAPLAVKQLMDKKIKNLSGGELQRIAITLCLATEADMYLFDEPSAYLDSNQRMNAAKTIRRIMEKSGRSAMVVDHDIYFLDMVSDSMMVFGGEPGHHGVGEGPYDMRVGMNAFLKAVDITFRRDADTHRPRINKPDSRLDRDQKLKGEYYYA